MSCVRVADDFQQLCLEEQCATTRWTDFFFDMPDFITVPTYEKGREHQLPPSIRVVKAVHSTELPYYNRGVVAGNCDVIYHIEAKILKANKVVGVTQREIIVMPCTEPPPPLDTEDLLKEYQLHAASSMGSFWNPKKRIAVTVLSKEPRPVILPTTKGQSPPTSTEVLLNFTTQKICDGDVEGVQLEPPFTECEVVVTLEAITYFVEHEKARVMSVTEAENCPFTILKRRQFKPQTRKLKLTGWERIDGGVCKSSKWNSSVKIKTEFPGSAASHRIVQWTSTTSLMTLLPDDLPRLPSFFSTLVSRRYAFDLQVMLGPRLHKPMYLRIPVQIVHGSVGKHPDGPLEGDFEEDLNAPAYAP